MSIASPLTEISTTPSFQALAAGAGGSIPMTFGSLAPEVPHPTLRSQDADERGAMLLASVANGPITPPESVTMPSARNALSMLLPEIEQLDSIASGKESKRAGKPRASRPEEGMSAFVSSRQTNGTGPNNTVSASKIPPSIQKALEIGPGSIGSPREHMTPAPQALLTRPPLNNKRPLIDDQRSKHIKSSNQPPFNHYHSQAQLRGLSPEQLMFIQYLSQTQQQQQQQQQAQAQLSAGNQGMFGHWPPDRVPATQLDIPQDTLSLIDTLNSTATTLSKLVPVLVELVATLKNKKRRRADEPHDSDEDEWVPPTKRAKPN